MTEPKNTIVLNGAWGRIFSGIVLAAVLAGASGLVLAYRMSDAQGHQADQVSDHEKRLRALESGMTELRSGVAILLERTAPKR